MQIFDKAFNLLGILGDPLRLDLTPLFNKVGTGEIEVSASDPMLDFMLAHGSRCRITYKGGHEMSGPLLHPTGKVTAFGTVIFQIEDDYRYMPNTLGWVMPNESSRSSGKLAPLDLSDHAQAWTDAAMEPGLAYGYGYYVFPDGSGGSSILSSAESAIKNLITVNMVSRMGRPVTVSPDLARGGDARAAGMLPSVRMTPLDEAVAALLKWSGLGLRFQHDGLTPTITAEVWQPATWPLDLTVDSGVVLDGDWSQQYPTATRIVGGGPGEDVARAFWDVRDTTGLEAEYGDIIEVFRDATGATLNWPGTLADAYRIAKYYLLRTEVATADKNQFTGYMNATGAKGLAEGAPTSGLSLTLSETPNFQYSPTGFRRGDHISIMANGIPFTDQIMAVNLKWDKTNGAKVTPQVGNRTDNPDELFARAISQLAAAQRRLSTSR
ncbi:hypothetical protein [Cryobacterium sp. Hh11]|uniref:Gp37-like protein n=1 Tax=Cryobacterium sp. Hh11 TaxID=2555868 RepID=UPI00141B8901|nr:hypothetical protein [Cryobacterium sp. Hh11]